MRTKRKVKGWCRGIRGFRSRFRSRTRNKREVKGWRRGVRGVRGFRGRTRKDMKNRRTRGRRGGRVFQDRRNRRLEGGRRVSRFFPKFGEIHSRKGDGER